MAGERMVQAEDGTFVPESYYADSGKEERVLTAMAKRLVAMERKIENLTAGNRSPQLGHSTVHDGSLLYRDSDGNIRRVEGRQADGTVTAQDINAPAPPAPSAAFVEALNGGFTVRWDGTFTGGQARPSDWRRTDVHIDLGSGFTPTPATVDGGIFVADGATLHFTTNDYVPHYVKLVAVNTSGTESLASTEVSVTPTEGEPAPNSVGSTHLQDGAVEPQHLTAELLLASRIITGNPTGARITLDGVANQFTAHRPDGFQTFLIDGATGTILAVGEYATAASGRRMVINEGNVNATTIRWYPGPTEPQNTSHCALYKVDDSPNLVAVPLRDVNGDSGFLNLHPNSAQLGWGNINDATNVDGGYVRIDNSMVTLTSVQGQQYHGIWMRHRDSGGVARGSADMDFAMLHAARRPVLRAIEANLGLQFYNDGSTVRLQVTNYAASALQPLEASNVSVPSSRRIKQNIRELSESAVGIIRNAPSLEWEYIPTPAYTVRRPLETPNPDGSEFEEVEIPAEIPVRAVGPMAEDLPEWMVSRDANDPGNLSVGLRDQIGILWKAAEEAATERDELKAQLAALTRRVETLERRSTAPQ